ncbi:MAG: MopE-related protein [Nanoarchaeota archaeon]
MKTAKKLILCFVVMCLMLSMVTAVSAGRTVQDVTLNGESSVDIAAGKAIATDVTVKLTSSSTWKKTQYRIGSGNYICKNTQDYNSGTHTVSFNVNSPSNKGDYDFQVWACDNSCNAQNPCSADTLILSNPDGIHVVSKCRDSIVDPGEICDGNSRTCTTSKGYSRTQSCKSSCSAWNFCTTTEKCSDGIVNGPEECDDGNKKSGDGCSSACLTEITYYKDKDNDGYGNAANSKTRVNAPNGYVPESGDCDDNNANINPGMAEICNNIDDNCKGAIDDGLTRADNNLFGLCSANIETCSAGEWADSDVNYLPLNETCDGFDNNCNNETDEGVKSLFYRDADADGFGDVWAVVSECVAPEGYLANNADCNDENAGISPNAEEVCNGIDDNCDGNADEGETCEYVPYYCDNDVDGFLSASPSDGCNTYNCVSDECSTQAGTDCNDENVDVYPDAEEVCNGIDDNCNDGVDEYLIRDDDKLLGLCSANIEICSAGEWFDSETNYVSSEEICDGFDNDCDGAVDNAGNIMPQEIQSFVASNILLSRSCYTGPEETSGVGECAAGLQTCTEGSWEESCSGEVLPAEEICDGLDNDCDGETDEGNFSDADADGIKDCVDDDNDNDGVSDSEDLIGGDSSDINTNVQGGLFFFVDDVQDAASHTGIGRVRIADSTGNALVEFDYDFANALNLGSINITSGNESGFGSVIIKGINLSGMNITKTAYIERVSASDSLCIIDNEVDSIVIEGDCMNGIKLSCPGTNGNYSCELTDNNTGYKVSGLKHSAVSEYSYSAPRTFEAPILYGSSGDLIVVPHNVPKPVEAPAEEVPAEESAEESAEEEEAVNNLETEAEAPAAQPTIRARLAGITGRMVTSVKESPGAWGSGLGGILAVLLITAIYISTRKVNKQFFKN